MHDEALVYSRQGRFVLARTMLERAHFLDPAEPHVATTYACELLRAGEFERAWPRYNFRHRIKNAAPTIFQQMALLHKDFGTGSAIAWLEQGLGEQILFAQLIPHLTDNVIVIACDGRLIPLLARAFPDRQFTAATEAAGYTIQHYDHQIPIADMPGRDPGCFPPKHPQRYLFADDERAWVTRGSYQLALEHPAQKIIGCAWRTTVSKTAEHKTCALKHWGPIFAQDALFLSLQHSLEDRETDGTPLMADDTLDTAQDLEGLAASIMACDGIVTTSNTIAHLASALGRETLVMAPHGGDRSGLHWAWGLKDHSAFYPKSTTIVRCADNGVWDKPIAAAAQFVRDVAPAWRAL